MSEQEQTNAFAEDLDRLIERYRKEFEITYASVVGTLFLKATLLANEAAED